jgi:regulator of sigma E protease
VDVLENSPASEAGLQSNDVIAAIDGRAASALTLTTVQELFERPASYKLTVLRGDQTLQITLTPRQLV